MLINPMKVDHASYDLARRRWAVATAELAIQLAQQAGEAVARPVPERWMRKAAEVLEQEFQCAARVLEDLWERYEPAPQPRGDQEDDSPNPPAE